MVKPFPIRNANDLIRFIESQADVVDPLKAVLWWGSHMRVKSAGELMSWGGRECVEMFSKGIEPTTVDHVDQQLSRLRENIADNHRNPYTEDMSVWLEQNAELVDAKVWNYFTREWFGDY
jgi:hypothetical protein